MEPNEAFQNFAITYNDTFDPDKDYMMDAQGANDFIKALRNQGWTIKPFEIEDSSQLENFYVAVNVTVIGENLDVPLSKIKAIKYLRGLTFLTLMEARKILESREHYKINALFLSSKADKIIDTFAEYGYKAYRTLPLT